MENKPTWADEFEKMCFSDIVGNGTNIMVLKQFISTKLAEQRRELIEIIKTPMSTEFEDVEEESADYSIEDFRARLLSTLTTK